MNMEKDPDRSGESPTPPRRPRSLRLRLSGWTDSELEGLAGAVRELGPGLEQQVRQWVEAERRAAIGLVLNDICGRLRDPLRDARVLAGDLNARDLVAPAGKQKVRLLLAEIDRVSQTLESEERFHFGLHGPSEPALDRTGSGKETRS